MRPVASVYLFRFCPTFCFLNWFWLRGSGWPVIAACFELFLAGCGWLPAILAYCGGTGAGRGCKSFIGALGGNPGSGFGLILRIWGIWGIYGEGGMSSFTLFWS